ncbi:DUF4190 domain-containing protein [Rathayibacter sp. VKM Ac-2760]|uniref:DUF4190 domain-containing protein n=1 Tax=Rathayibacter sp. VKM Ac-2760 TaxID=2609253 RepID=UPI001FCA209F|nr:DUF4190 domain-containing protein [Rathayibacter sp. VKM Ac-2760]
MSNTESTPSSATTAVPTTATAADAKPTEVYGATAVLTDPAPVQEQERERAQREQQPAAQPAAQHPAPYGVPPVAPAAATPAPSTPFSLTSLILGVTSVFFGLTVIAPVAGLIFGILGLRREPTGRTLAIWGIVLNAVMIGLVVLFVVALLFLGLLVPFVALATGTDVN